MKSALLDHTVRIQAEGNIVRPDISVKKVEPRFVMTAPALPETIALLELPSLNHVNWVTIVLKELDSRKSVVVDTSVPHPPPDSHVREDHSVKKDRPKKKRVLLAPTAPSLRGFTLAAPNVPLVKK